MTIILSACLGEDGPGDSKILHVDILPDEVREKFQERQQSLVEYLARSMDTDYELFIPDDYGHPVKLSIDGEIGLAYFDGFTFLKANISSGTKALVMRNIDCKSILDCSHARGFLPADKRSVLCLLDTSTTVASCVCCRVM